MNIITLLKSHKNKKNKTSYFIIVMFSVIGLFFISSTLFFTSNEYSKKNTIDDGNFPQGYKIVSPTIPKEIKLFGEKVPLENFEVYERIDREVLVNTYFHSSTIIAIKRAYRWFPVIEPILKQNNIPDDFKYLAVIESNLENVVSAAGAAGYWQFIKSTGLKYGLEINDEVDERYHVEKSTQSACNYLQEAYKIFGNWTMTAASYNAGLTGIEKWRGLQKTNNYYNLVLGSETSRYVPRIISIKLIMENPKLYGYDLTNSNLYEPLKYKEIELNTQIENLAEYSLKLGINYKILKLYNPWLRETFLKNKNGSAYKIKLPIEGSINIISE